MERELLLRLRAENSELKAKLAESVAQLDALKAKTAEVSAASVAGSKAQADAHVAAFAKSQGATAGIVAQLEESRLAMAALTASTVTGGTEMVAALGRAAIAIAGLEAEIAASGGLASPEQVAALAGYKAELAAIVPKLQQVAPAAASAATGTRVFGAATAQAGQAIAGKTVNLGALTSGFLRFLGPIGLATAAIALLPSLIRGVRDAFKTLSDIIDGSVSKALAEMRDGFEKAQGKLEGLDAASRNFRDAADLMAAGGLNAKGVIDGLGDSFKVGAETAANFGGAVVFAGDGFVSLGGGAATAKSAIDGLSNTINEVRLTAPEAARAAAESFLELSRSFAAGKITAGEFFERVRGLREGLLPLAKVSEEVGTAIKEKFGKKFEEAQAQFGAFSAAIPSIISDMEKLKAGGLSSGEAFEVLKSKILAAAKDSETFAGIIDKLPPQMQAWIAELKNLAKGHDIVSEAIKKVREEAEKAAAKHREAVLGMAEDFHELDRAYREDAVEIEKHRAKTVAAVQEEAAAARTSAEDQIKALNERNRNAQLSNAEYQAERRKIDDEEIAARRAAEKEIAQINADAAEDLKKVAGAFKEKSQKVRESLAEEGTSLTAASLLYAANERDLDALIKKVNAHAIAHANAAGVISGASSQLVTKLNEITTAANAADEATSRLFSTRPVTTQTPAAGGIPGGSVTTEPSYN